jgi:hypothetical protein
VVVRGPGLVGDVVELARLALGEAEHLEGSRAELRDEGLECRPETLRRQRIPLAPGLVARGERAVARQNPVELAVCHLELRLGHPLRSNAVAAFDLIGVGDLLARELARDGLEPDDLVPQPAVGGVEQRGGIGDERHRLAERLGVHPLLQLRRAVVRVHEPVDVPPEPEPEPDVVLGHRSERESSRSAGDSCSVNSRLNLVGSPSTHSRQRS